MTDVNGILVALWQYWPWYVILAGVLYWLLVKYIPSQDALHKEQIEAIQANHKKQQDDSNALFKASLEMVVNNNTQVSNGLMNRLEKIEAHIKL